MLTTLAHFPPEGCHAPSHYAHAEDSGPAMNAYLPLMNAQLEPVQANQKACNPRVRHLLLLLLLLLCRLPASSVCSALNRLWQSVATLVTY